MLSQLGLTLARQVPIEMIAGLLSGSYSLHGGVVRNGAGQIVAHLATVGTSGFTSLVPGLNALSSAVANGQLLMLAKDVKELQSAVSSVLNIAATGAALSGVGLVVSIAGFVYLSKRFDQIEKLLGDVKELIEARNLAELKAAMGHMKNAEEIACVSHDNSMSLLLEAQKSFSTLAHLYGDLWAKATDPKQVNALESFYTLAFTGASIANSELGMHGVAARQFSEHLDQWKRTARLQVRERVLRKDLLKSVSAEVVTTSEFVKLLDFAHDTQRGIDWLDDLRSKETKSWIPQLSKTISNPWEKSDLGMIDTAKCWQQRSSVLESHEAHLFFLADKKHSVSHFSRGLLKAANDNCLDAICALPVIYSA